MTFVVPPRMTLESTIYKGHAFQVFIDGLPVKAVAADLREQWVEVLALDEKGHPVIDGDEWKTITLTEGMVTAAPSHSLTIP